MFPTMSPCAGKRSCHHPLHSVGLSHLNRACREETRMCVVNRHSYTVMQLLQRASEGLVLLCYSPVLLIVMLYPLQCEESVVPKCPIQCSSLGCTQVPQHARSIQRENSFVSQVSVLVSTSVLQSVTCLTVSIYLNEDYHDISQLVNRGTLCYGVVLWCCAVVLCCGVVL